MVFRLLSVLVAIDVDSTLHDYWEQFSAAAMALHGVDLPYADQRAWAVDALTGDQVRQVVEATHDDERISEAVAYPGAAEAISAWRRAGHQILITTHRRTDAHDVTAEWLAGAGHSVRSAAMWEEEGRSLPRGRGRPADRRRPGES